VLRVPARPARVVVDYAGWSDRSVGSRAHAGDNSELLRVVDDHIGADVAQEADFAGLGVCLVQQLNPQRLRHEKAQAAEVANENLARVAGRAVVHVFRQLARGDKRHAVDEARALQWLAGAVGQAFEVQQGAACHDGSGRYIRVLVDALAVRLEQRPEAVAIAQ